MFAYIEKINSLIKEIESQEADAIQQAADKLAKVLESGHSIFAFGAGHASILSQELFFRAGGLIPMNPIFGREIMLDTAPITKTSQMERLEGYGQILAAGSPMTAGDAILIHSVSGRNPVAIDVALSAKEKGLTIIGITNRTYSLSVASRHSSGKRLLDLCDIVIDNHGDIGDACCQIPGLDTKVGASSSVIGCLIVNTLLVELVSRLQVHGIVPPPVFYSANLDGGEEKNKELFERFKGQIHYLY
ncbi:sugar isomerase domain-containing protein [Clostridiales bacterium COT073_COT-073]|nr:sugar isomerase domain-containing protein [Clostridiales bacterium COT073_COT-073]